MAHQLGFAAEDEANYIAYLACSNNPNPEFLYSANYWIMFSAMRSLRRTDEAAYQKLRLTIERKVLLDEEFAKSISSSFSNPIQDFTSGALYDLFLKANNQENGIKSYGLVTELMIGEMRKNNLSY